MAVSESGSGIWRHAELESWDDQQNQGQVVFLDNGSSEKLGIEAMAVSQYAEVSEDEEDSDYSSSGQSGLSDYDEEEEDNCLPPGIGFVESTALQKGIQTDTAIFAKWENHTRGIASKMMANMGYREGMGLGTSGQGIVDPILVKVLPPKQSLDHALKSSTNNEESQEKKKKRSRGGKRKRDKKFAEAARAAKQQEEEQRTDVFSLINNHLATHAQMINEGTAKKKQKGKEGNKKEDRRSLVAYDDEVKDLRVQVGKLEEMVNRNRKEKAVFEAATRKLIETRKTLAEAEAKHASASHAVVSKEKEKRWLRF